MSGLRALPLVLGAFALGLAGCGDATPAGDDGPTVPEGVAVVAGETFVGRLIENERLGIANPLELILEDGKAYRLPRYRLGTVNVVGLGNQLEDLVGKLVVVRGATRPLAEAIEEIGAPDAALTGFIPPALRDDWCSPEAGFEVVRSTHARLAALRGIVATEAEALAGFAVLSSDSAGVGLRLRNPFATPIDSLDVVLQYEVPEGVRPRSPYLQTRTLSLAPNEVTELDAAPHPAAEEVAHYELHTIAIEHAGDVVIDVRLRVRD